MIVVNGGGAQIEHGYPREVLYIRAVQSKVEKSESDPDAYGLVIEAGDNLCHLVICRVRQSDHHIGDTVFSKDCLQFRQRPEGARLISDGIFIIHKADQGKVIVERAPDLHPDILSQRTGTHNQQATLDR